MKRIIVESTVSVGVDLQTYHGTLLIGEVTFEYQTNFTVPIADLMDPKIEQRAAREIGILVLKKDATLIDMTDNEFSFFIQLIGGLVTWLLCSTLTELSDSGDVVDGGKLAEAMTVPMWVIEALTSPKFGCRFNQ